MLAAPTRHSADKLKQQNRYFTDSRRSGTTRAAAPLARLEMKIILEELVRRLPQMRLVEGQGWASIPTLTFRGVQNLLVVWSTTRTPRS